MAPTHAEGSRQLAEDEVSPRQPSARDLIEIQSLYDRGRLYDAYRATLPLAPLRDWKDADALVLAGRLAHHLGATKMADALMLLAWRRAPENHNARYFGIRAFLSRRGPIEGLEMMDRYPVPVGDPIHHAEWLAMKGQALGLFRDFARAEALLAEARSVAPNHHWIALEASSLLAMQDRLDEALAEARRGFALQPLHPGASVAQAQILLLLGRPDEAIGGLQSAMQTLQSASVASFLAAILIEQERYEEALAAWEACQVLMPLMDKTTRAGLHSHLSHMQYLLGNIDESKRLAIAAGDPFLKELAGRLDESAAARHKRLKLDVPFIKQHYVTCVPTTMAMLGRFWRIDLEHLAIAEQITYGGTATHRERRWAEEHGWIVREITVTWEAAVSLLDRGIPFTLTTTSGDGAHEQAVVGYDTHRRTFLIRDPSTPLLVEVDVKSLLESDRSGGPRGMVMLPSAEAARLDGLELPEVAERDVHYRIACALERHDRNEAARLCAELPPGRIGFTARNMIAMYDSDPAALLRSLDDALAAYPDDTTLLVHKQQCLLNLFRMNERAQLLRRLAGEEKAHPIFRRIYAGALSESATDHDQALAHLRKYLRVGGLDPEALRILANIVWADERFDRATLYYRLASSLGETNEQLATSYFIAAGLRGEQEEALQYLRDRARRASERSSQPARTLFWALTQLFRVEEALAVLTDAMTARPDDGELLLFAADAFARYSRPEADELLLRAEPLTRRRDFLATRAGIAAHRGQLQKSLTDWREVYELQPHSMDAHQAIGELLEQTEGHKAVIAFLQSLIDRFPEYRFAYALLAKATRDVDPSQHERVVRRYIEVAPDDAWAHRELAEHFADVSNFDDALSEARLAEEIAPTDPAGPTVLGHVLLVAGRKDEAREAFLGALSIFADEANALAFLGSTAENAEEREQLYADVFDTVLTRSPYGEGLLAWYGPAAGTIRAERLLELTSTAVAKRPQAWQCHSIHIRQLVRMKRVVEAVAAAKDASTRFPLQPALFLDAAAAWRASGDSDQEAAALENALRLDATNSTAAVLLAQLLQRREENDRVVSVLTAAAAAVPLNSAVHRMLGDVLWQRGEKEEALQRLARAARLWPDDESIWEELAQRAAEAGRKDFPLETALQLVEEKPGNGTAWLALSLVEPDPSSRLAAVERAIALDWRLESAYDRKAILLAEGRRFDEAVAVCTTIRINGRTPLALRGREAWVYSRMNDLDMASTQMSALLAQEPNYLWGWYQLCLWSRARNDRDRYRQAAAELTRLDPANPISWNYLGEAELISGNAKRAEECFDESLKLDPGNVFAAFTMIDVHLENKRVARAEELLVAAEPRTHHQGFKLRRLQIAIRRSQRVEAAAVMKELAADPALDFDLVQQAIDEMNSPRHADDLRRVLSQTALGCAMHPAAASQLVRFLLADGNADQALNVIGKVYDRDQAQARNPAYAFLDVTGSSKQKVWLDKFLNAFGGWAVHDTEIWGMVGYCRVSTKQYHANISSMRDWPNRDGLRPFMLLNLALSYRYTGADAEASKVSEFALTLDDDHTSNSHRIWLSLDEALSGRFDSAQRRLDKVKLQDVNTFHQHIAYIAGALLAAHRESAAGAWKRAAGAQLRVLVQAKATRTLSPLAVRYYKQVVRALRVRFGSGVWDSLWTWMMASRV